MKLILKKTPRPDPKEIRSRLRKGYGVNHPEKIFGYADFFFDPGDVFASDTVAAAMERIEAFRLFVHSCIQDFRQDRYGYISQSDHDENVEDKWLGGGWELFGRYAYGPVDTAYDPPMPAEYIKIRYYRGSTYVLYDAEPDWLILQASGQDRP